MMTTLTVVLLEGGPVVGPRKSPTWFILVRGRWRRGWDSIHVLMRPTKAIPWVRRVGGVIVVIIVVPENTSKITLIQINHQCQDIKNLPDIL